MTIEANTVVATLAALAQYQIGRDDVGRSVYVTDPGRYYQAMREGRGLEKWGAIAGGTAQMALGMQAIRRTVNYADTDVAIANTTVTIDIGALLPADAVVVGYRANNTEDWDDGAAGTFEMDLGDSGGTGNEYVDALDIDGGIADLVSLFDAYVPVFAGGDQPSFTVTSSANLSTATAGNTVVTIYYFVPDVTTEVAP